MPINRPEGLNFSDLNPPNHHLNSPQLSFSTGKLKFPDTSREYDFTADDLIDEGVIGRGNFGTVNRMIHRESNHVLAVKRIRSTTVHSEERKRLLRELETVMSADKCETIVRFFGALFYEGDCWICMEIMDISLDKLYKNVYKTGHRVPEPMIGYIAVATIQALNYLRQALKIIHRDVKPSNILLDRHGMIKLCDFGIAGELVDSIAKTQEVGCKPYMAPERVSMMNTPYDVRSDVWSLGITLFEVAMGKFPYSNWNTAFDQVDQVVKGEAPMLCVNTPDNFSIELVQFVNSCLVKDRDQRPRYNDLMTKQFYQLYDLNGETLAMALFRQKDRNISDRLNDYCNMTSAGLTFFASDCVKRIDSGPSDEHFHYFAELLALHEQFFGLSCPDVIKKSANVFITMYGKNPKYADDSKMAFVYYLLGRYSKTMNVNSVMKTLYDNNRFRKLAMFYELWMGGLVDDGKRKEAEQVLSLARKNSAQPEKLIEKLDQKLKLLSPIRPLPPQKTASVTETITQNRRPSLLTASVRKSLSTPPASYGSGPKTPKGTPRKFTNQTPKTTGLTSQRKRKEESTNKETPFDKSEPEDEVEVITEPLLPDNMHVKLEPTILPETSQFQFRPIRSSSPETTNVCDPTQTTSSSTAFDEKENSQEVFEEVKNNSFDFFKITDDPTNRRLSTFEKRRKSLKKGGISFEQSTFLKPVTYRATEELQDAIENLCIETKPWSQDEQKRNPFRL
ncbi:unnamed protein product, partial [Mesorhabditis belari]|uniref:mitogen-activated protein kinase kinase n=1 Tax=Mesorhabditis belari TaxID=2138241 RepID=A0AAF3EH58_9BILA